MPTDGKVIKIRDESYDKLDEIRDAFWKKYRLRPSKKSIVEAAIDKIDIEQLLKNPPKNA